MSHPRSHIMAWSTCLTTLSGKGKRTREQKNVPFSAFTHKTDNASIRFSVGQSVKCDVQTEGDAAVLPLHAVFSLNRKTGELSLDGKVKHGDVWVAPLGTRNMDASSWKLLNADEVVNIKTNMLRVSQFTAVEFGPDASLKAASRSPKKLKSRKRLRPTERETVVVDMSDDDNTDAQASASASPVKKRARGGKASGTKTKTPVKRSSVATPVVQTKTKKRREAAQPIENADDNSDSSSTVSTDTHTTPPTRTRTIARAPLLDVPSPSHRAARRPARMPSRRIVALPETTANMTNPSKTLTETAGDFPLVHQQQLNRMLPVLVVDTNVEDMKELTSTTDFLDVDDDDEVVDVEDTLQRKSKLVFVRVMLVAVGVIVLLFATIATLQHQRQQRLDTVSSLMPDLASALPAVDLDTTPEIEVESDDASADVAEEDIVDTVEEDEEQPIEQEQEEEITTLETEVDIDVEVAEVDVDVVAEEQIVEDEEEHAVVDDEEEEQLIEKEQEGKEDEIVEEEEEVAAIVDEQEDQQQPIETESDDVVESQVASPDEVTELPEHQGEEEQVVATFTDKMSAATIYGELGSATNPQVFVSAVYFDEPRVQGEESNIVKRARQASTESARWLTRIGVDACFWLPATAFGKVGVDLELPAGASGACHLGMDVRVADGDNVVLGQPVGVLSLGGTGGFMCEHVFGPGRQKYPVSLAGGAPTTLRVALGELWAPVSGELCARGLYLECE